jgi:hypothetical protein
MRRFGHFRGRSRTAVVNKKKIERLASRASLRIYTSFAAPTTYHSFPYHSFPVLLPSTRHCKRGVCLVELSRQPLRGCNLLRSRNR